MGFFVKQNIILLSDLSRRASVRDGAKTVAFEAGNPATSPGEGMGNGAVVSVKPKSRSGSIIGAISPIMGTGTFFYIFVFICIRYIIKKS